MALAKDQDSLLKLKLKAPLWRSRGYLPHFETAERAQMITYRLHDSLPRAVVAKLEQELGLLDPRQMEIERRRRMEEYLDKGAGSCALLNASIGQMIEQNLLNFHRKRYELHAWVIMPNHVHVLISPEKDALLSHIIHSWKSYTAKKANAILCQQGGFWQREYFDRVIRNEKHFRRAIAYIHENPVKAGLCETPADWQFSSSRYLVDNNSA